MLRPVCLLLQLFRQIMVPETSSPFSTTHTPRSRALRWATTGHLHWTHLLKSLTLSRAWHRKHHRRHNLNPFPHMPHFQHNIFTKTVASAKQVSIRVDGYL